MTRGPGTNTGHGHVWKRPDGMVARCGGPAICKECAADQAQIIPETETWTHGYNSCLHVAISALNFLASYPRPTGGQQAYNSEHLLQIADEIKRTIAHNVKAARTSRK